MRWGAILVNEWMTAQSQSRQSDFSTPFPWLTVETALWGLVLISSLGLRLLRLDAAPLNTAEARDALGAWRFAQGQGTSTATGYSPLLFSGQWFTFLIFGASDLAARLLPALAGTALALVPALLRKELGRLGALVAGTLLALSPTAVNVSRTASGDVLVALGALLFACGLWRIVKGEQSPTADEIHPSVVTHHIASAPDREPRLSNIVYTLPLGIALMLVASPLAYSALLALGFALTLLVLIDADGRDRLQEGWIRLRTTPNLIRYTLGVFIGASILFSTAFAWHFEGLAAAADLLPEWLSGFVRWPDSPGVAYPVFILVIYEPLILLLGVAGVALATLRGGTPSLFFALWSIGALLLALIRPGHGPGDVLLTLLPLVCLAGLALDALFSSLRRWGHWLNEGLYLVASAPLWAYMLLNLAIYSSRPQQYTHIQLLFFDVALPTYLSMAFVTGVLLLIFALGIGYVQGLGPALRSLGLSTTLALLLYTVAATWGVNQNRPADPREPLVLEPTAPEVQLLRDSLAHFSRQHTGDAHAIDLTILIDDPALTWVLRDFHQAQFAETIGTSTLASAIVASQTQGKPLLGENYIGQDFPLRRRWNTDGLACRWNLTQYGFDQARQLDCSSLVQWFVYRRSPDRPSEEQVVLWVQQDLLAER